MSNERLRGAILQARLSIDQVAEHTGVDQLYVVVGLGPVVPDEQHPRLLSIMNRTHLLEPLEEIWAT